MTFSTWERWTAIDFGVEVTSHYFLKQLGSNNMFRLHVWKLDPVVFEIMRNPENGGVDTLSSSFLSNVAWDFFNLVACAHGDPVVVFKAVHFSKESHCFSAAGGGELLN